MLPKRQRAKRKRRRLQMLQLEPRLLLTGTPIITEFLAVNNNSISDDDGDQSDWIEIFNPTDSDVSLDGWYLTDRAADLRQWQFPDIDIPAKEYLTVFASNKDRTDPANPLHTNFELNGEGEHLALAQPDGITVASAFDFPAQLTDVSYGVATSVTSSPLVDDTTDFQLHVPANDNLGATWNTNGFIPGGGGETWTASAAGVVGYDTGSTLAAAIDVDVETELLNINPGGYLRYEFDVADTTAVEGLTLAAQYDDGFVAYLNGQEIANRNARQIGQSPAAGLVSYWDFEGNANDSSGSYDNNAGTVADNFSPRGGVERYGAGVVGQALALGVQGGDPTDLLAAFSDDVSLPSQYTIETWVKPTDLTGSWQRLVLNWGADLSYHFAIRNNSGLTNAVSLFHGEADGGQPNANGGTVVEDQWQHIAGVADGQFLRVYLNGTEVATAAYDGSIHPSDTEGLGLGDGAGANSTIKYNGWIDELAIWDVPLTADQIESHFLSAAEGYGLTPTGGQPDVVEWNSAARSDRLDTEALTAESISLPEDTTDLLQNGTNVLAVHALNNSAGDDTFLFHPELAEQATAFHAQSRYFQTPSPGTPNGLDPLDQGPIISNVNFELLPAPGFTSVPLVDDNSTHEVFVPGDANLESDWFQPVYTPGDQGETWTQTAGGGLGYDLDADFDAHIDVDLETELHNVNSTAYIRTEFNVADPSQLDTLLLDAQYDDGFVAYLNGEEVASRNARAEDPNDPDPGLVTYYSFDNHLNDTASTFDSGTGQSEDTLVPGLGAARYVPGIKGEAIALNDIAADPRRLDGVPSTDVNLPASYAIEAWVFPTNLDTWGRLILNWGGAGQSYHFAIQNTNQVSLFHRQTNGAQPNTQGGTVVENQWQHIAGVADGSTLRVYLNGVEVASTPYDGTINTTNGPLGVGDNPGGNDGTTLRYEGYLDEVAIWERPLTPAEVLAHFDAGSDGYALDFVRSELAFDATAPTERDDNDAVVAERIDISEHLGLLQPGSNLLAIQPVNTSNSDRDLLISAELTGQFGSDTLQPVHVTVEVDSIAEPLGDITLHHRVMFDSEFELTMFDDGQHGDGAAGDGVFGATIPAGIAATGEMLRFYVTAEDTANASSRAPLFPDPTNSAEYFGLVITDDVQSQLPVLRTFVDNPAAAESAGGTRATIAFDGEFYDNVFMRLRGQTSRNWPKKSFKVDLNRDHHFLFDPQTPRVEEFNLNTTYTDKSYVRSTLAYEDFRDAGVAYSATFPIRIQQNNDFYSVAIFTEQPDADYLARNNLDPDGSLYKVVANGLTGNANSGMEKKTRRDEDHSDAQALINGLALSGANLDVFLKDNVDLPAQINYMATNVVIQNIDRTVKNYYIYRDSNGNGLWRMLPWDVDLSYGPDALNTDVIDSSDDFPNDNTSHPYMGGSAFPFNNLQNKLLDDIFRTPETEQMFLRRLRTLMDELMDPVEQRHETRIAELLSIMDPDVALDQAKWGANAHYGSTDFTLQAALERMNTEYFALRRTHLFTTHNIGNIPDYALAVGIPNQQLDFAVLAPAERNIAFGEIEFAPTSSNQDEEFIELKNDNAFAIDISGWKLRGAVSMTFDPGTVIPANSSIFATPDEPTFRARATGPRGGQSLLIQGNYNGHLSSFGETIRLEDSNGNELTSLSYAGDPTVIQENLRITEFNYNPPPPTVQELAVDAGLDNDDFEFIEFTNIGVDPIPLGGVQITDGVVYTFPAVDLQPGELIVVAKNPVAFQIRYGGSINELGPFVSGSLNNGGETIKVEDIDSGTVQEFTYNDSGDWPSLADGKGATVEIRDTSLNDDDGLNWRASFEFNGTPGEISNPLVTIVINEVLSHTDLPQLDSIELYNTTDSDIDIGGWWLTDSCNDLQKYQFPANTILLRNDYLVVTETDFNPGGGVNLDDFALNGAHGDELFLTEANNGEIVSFTDHIQFGAAANGESIGRFPNGIGPVVPLASVTLDNENSQPRIGPVVISEVMYNPPTADNGFAPEILEFVEIHNTSGAAVDLGNWRIRGGVDFDFAGGPLADDAYLVVVSLDPVAAENAAMLTAFRDFYQIDETVELVGPFSSQLGNSGDTFRLERPDQPPLDEPTFIPRLLEDQVSYDDQSPWPLQPDGGGASLARLTPEELGTLATSFAADGPTPGTGAVSPFVVSTQLNSLEVDPVDLPKGSQPTDWSQQQSQWSSLDITFNEPTTVSVDDIVLTNLGINASIDADVIVQLDASQLTTTGDTVRIVFDPAVFEDGVYQLEILASATDIGGSPLDGNGDSVGGDDYSLVGSEANKFYRLLSDFNGDFGVSVFDFSTFSYWFGVSVPNAPSYADMNRDGGVSVFDFTFFSLNFGTGITFPVAFAPLNTAEDALPIEFADADLPIQQVNRIELPHVEARQRREREAMQLDIVDVESETDLAIEQIVTDVWQNWS
jgi:hypothetical protein